MRPIPLIAFVFAVGLASKAPAAVITWGGDYVSSDQNLNGTPSEPQVDGLNLDLVSRDNRLATPVDGNFDDGIKGVPFSTTRVFSPTSGYTGPTFYGGSVKGLLDTVGNPSRFTDYQNLQIQNKGPNDVIDLRFQANNTASDIHFALVFQVPTGTNPLGAGSTFSFSTEQNTSAQITKFGEARWIVMDENGNWWISASNAAGKPNVIPTEDGGPGIKNNTTYTSSFNAGELTYWAPYGVTESTTTPSTSINFEPAYDPAVGGEPIGFDITSATNPFIAKTFTNIQYVGLYIEDDQFTNNVLQFSIATLNFSIVPEPSSVLMLLAGGVGLAGMVWMHRRKMLSAAAIESRSV